MTKTYVKTDYVPADCDYLTVGKIYEGKFDEDGADGSENGIEFVDDKGNGCWSLLKNTAHLDYRNWTIVTEQEYLEQERGKEEPELSDTKEAITSIVKAVFDEVGIDEFKKTSLFMSNRNKEDQLTIRDRFAIAASEKDIDNYIMWNSATCREEARYMFADAMLKERNK